MPRQIQEIDPAHVSTIVENLPSTAKANAAKPDPEPIQFELARGKGLAVFRYPTAADLDAAERKAGKLTTLVGQLTDVEKIYPFAEALAAATCIQWGSGEKIPSPDRVRFQDVMSMRELFIKQVLMALTPEDTNDYVKLLEGQSTKGDGFDAYQVALLDGTELVFNEPSWADTQQREKAKTMSEGMIKLATALLASWNGEKISWTDAMQRFESLSLENFLRVANCLNNFRD